MIATSLQGVVRHLDELSDELLIYVPADREVADGDTPVLLLAEEEDEHGDAPDGWRYLLELFIVRDVLETWSAWRGGRMPTVQEACQAIVHYAFHDAYLPVE
ncbi:hypothetical protein ABGB16_32380 [Micromonospora sp. B11E3]|uniref:hypothetical protein n=1 Tax=Micromonospora sp. B11E3 TaxID=3153562 RepID=UPI00325F690C